MKKILTLVFILQDDKILLGLKKRGFGAGRWNGFGGKVEPGESIEEAAKREVFEESGITVNELEKRAIHRFSWQDREDILEVHTFLATEWNGEIRESEEMKPQWHLIADIPYDTMWSDDEYWLPLFLEGKRFITKFVFDAHDQVAEQAIKEVDIREITNF